jgi:hypothetical protein
MAFDARRDRLDLRRRDADAKALAHARHDDVAKPQMGMGQRE